MEQSSSSEAGSSVQRLGEFLVSIGAMSEDQVELVLKEQKNTPDKLFGQIAIEMGFIDDAAVDRYLQQKDKSSQ
ncbi:MAG: hypothetical protein ACQETQ_04435 [Spirochaetota bacterium]